jgi:hypothetical protein
MIHNAIKKAYEQFESRSWDKIYIALDIHGTVADADYTNNSECLYESCIQPLQAISKLPEVCVILFSCCHPESYESYFELFNHHGIDVRYFNDNPEVENTKTGCFDRKFYYNIIFEDKAGFEPWMWPSVRDAFLNYRQFNKRISELYGQ